MFAGRPKYASVAPASGVRPRETSCGIEKVSVVSMGVPFVPTTEAHAVVAPNLKGSSVGFPGEAEPPFGRSTM